MLIVVAGLAGTFVVGPFVNHATLRWMGWRVTLPLLFGWVPPLASLGHASVTCRRCATPLSPRLPRLGGPPILDPAQQVGEDVGVGRGGLDTAPSPGHQWSSRHPERGVAVGRDRRLPAWPWLLSRGRCRTCREPLQRWPLLVELATGALFALAAWQVDGWRLLAPTLVLFTGLVAVSTVDLLCSRIPTRFVYLTGGAVAVAALPRLSTAPDSLTGAAVGGALCLGALGAMHLVSPAMLGFGDVRLGTLIGLVVGWAGWTAAEPVLDPIARVVQAVFVAGIVGSLLGFALLAVRRANHAYPFGPCLALGAIATLLAL